MKILLAVDDSEFSKAAVNAIVNQFRPDGVEVHVLTVVETLRLAPAFVGMGVGPSVPADFAGVIEKWLDQAEQLVKESAKSLESAGFRVTATVKEGDAKSQILEYADEWRPDLIMVGSHGRKGINRFLLGSVSEAIARHAPCSVQIVRPMAAAARESPVAA
jgi:nucleotide-binding universal stress UspA family protein